MDKKKKKRKMRDREGSGDPQLCLFEGWLLLWASWGEFFPEFFCFRQKNQTWDPTLFIPNPIHDNNPPPSRSGLDDQCLA